MATCLGPQRSGCKGAGKDKKRILFWDLVRPAWSLAIALNLLHAGSTFSADTNKAPAETKADSPALGTNLLATFQLKKGFRIELAASEPMVTAPVAMAFDENGRLFVAEMRGADHRGGKLGRIRMLENMNDEGVFQNSTIYADGLEWPSAIACYAGGIFVADAPDIFYFKDTRGDGIADARQLVISGFGGTNTLDSNLLPNNFNWGPDNHIHASSGGIGGELSVKNEVSGTVSINRRDFSFDPRTLEVFPEAGPSESGLSFDSRGRKFVSDFMRPLMTSVYDPRYTLRNPFYPRPALLGTVADPAAPVYRFVAAPPRDSNGRQATNVIAAGRMTSSRGCVVYRGRAFPTNYFDNVFSADPEEHIVRRLVLRENGSTIVAQRAADEPNTEFLISKDSAFRPVQLINGPDGALYIADQQDGNERGRIYRVLPEKLKRSKLPQLGQAKTYDLVSTMAQSDGWHRDTAARLLYERKDSAAPALLRATLTRSRLPQARLLALRGLLGADALTEEDVLAALRDVDDRVREHGILISESLFRNGDASAAILAALRALLTDSSFRVRYQLAFTLGDLQRPDKAAGLGQILGRDPNELRIQNAVLSSAGNGAGNLFTLLAADAPFRNSAAGLQFLRELATMIGVSGHQDAVIQAANFIGRNTLSAAQSYALLYNLGEGLYRTRSSLALVDAQNVLQPFYSGALNLATDPSQSEAARVAATRLLGVSTFGPGSIGDWLLLVCSPPTTPALQSAAVETLSRYDNPLVVDGFLQMWPILAPMAKGRAITALLSRDSLVARVLDSLQAGKIGALDLSSTQRNFLRTHSVPDIRSRALQLLGPVPMTRPDVIQRFKPALTLRGASDRGREVFQQRCANCHVSSGSNQGAAFAPELLRARTYSKDRLLAKIVEPNVRVRPDYSTQVVESKEAQSLVGIITDSNKWTVTLKQTGADPIIWPQSNIRSVRSQTWSLMPEGTEVGMAAQDMADLLEYMTSVAR